MSTFGKQFSTGSQMKNKQFKHTDRIFSKPATALGVYKYKLQLEWVYTHRSLRAERDFRNHHFHIPDFTG